jgi:bifunctional DNase/RNase
MTVLEVVPTERGEAVLLVDEAESVVVPIFVGGTEALSIKLRLERQRYQRPLTHDLLDDVVGKLGGAVHKVQVDELRGNIFVGSVFVRSGGTLVTLDARPSDAIALALGNRVPIYVAEKVIDAGGVKKGDLEKRGPIELQPRGKLPEPMSL